MSSDLPWSTCCWLASVYSLFSKGLSFFIPVSLKHRGHPKYPLCWPWRFYLTNHFAWKLVHMKKQVTDFRIPSRPDLQGSSCDPVVQLTEESSKVGWITQYLKSQLCLASFVVPPSNKNCSWWRVVLHLNKVTRGLTTPEWRGRSDGRTPPPNPTSFWDTWALQTPVNFHNAPLVKLLHHLTPGRRLDHAAHGGSPCWTGPANLSGRAPIDKQILWLFSNKKTP